MADRINLARLAEPFPAEDIEWRVSQSGLDGEQVWVKCFAYITVRATQSRLDEVCGVENWRNEPPQFHQVLTTNEKRPNVTAVIAGLSIRIDGEWITKWGGAEPTQVEPVKGGLSSAEKRAGAQWGIGSYLSYLEESFAEASKTKKKGWKYARLPKDKGNVAYYWNPPPLPGWALPQEKEQSITAVDLNSLKSAWKAKFAAETTNPADLREGFSRFVTSTVGEFPLSDVSCWTRDALERCVRKIAATTEAGGVSSDVPFA